MSTKIVGGAAVDATSVDVAGAVMESDYSLQHSILLTGAGTGNPVPQAVVDDSFVGRRGGLTIKGMTVVESQALLNITDGADVTGSNPPQAHGASVHTDRTRELFLDVPYYGSSTSKGLELGPGNITTIYYRGKMPVDFVSLTSVKCIYYMSTTNAGQIVLGCQTRTGSLGQTYYTHTDNDSLNVITSATAINIIYSYTFTGILASVVQDDYMRLELTRTGTSASDTHTGNVVLMGLLITYTADQ